MARHARHQQQLLFAVVTLLLLGVMLPGFARKKPKKQLPAVKQERRQLPYNDRRRFDYYFLEAIAHFNAGRHEAALDLFQHCQQIDSTEAATDYYLARYYYALGNDSLATRFGENALRKDPANKDYLELMGESYLRQKQLAKAIETYEKLYNQDHSRSDVISLLVRLYQHTENYNMMLDALNRQEIVEGTTEDITLNKMYVYDQLGQSNKSLVELQHLSAAHPYDMHYKVMTANWLIQHKKAPEALRLLNDVLKEEPENVDAIASFYDYYRETGDEAKADEMMMRLLLNPKTSSDDRIRLCQYAYQTYEVEEGDSVKVLRLLNDILKAAPNDVAIVEMKASYLELKGFPQDSIDAMNRYILDIAPDNLAARYRYIVSLAKQDKNDEIVQLAQAGIDYHPTMPMFYYFKAVTLMLQDNNKSALETIESGLNKCEFENNAELKAQFFQICGDLYHELGQNEKAFQAYDECLKLNPDNVGCRNNYAYFLSLENRELDKAERLSRLTIEKEPTNPTYLDTYAWIRFMQKEFSDAKKYIDLALENSRQDSIGIDSAGLSQDSTKVEQTDTLAELDTLDQEYALSADVVEHAGDIYFHVGEVEKAVEFWTKALEMGSENALLPEKIKRRKYISNP